MSDINVLQTKVMLFIKWWVDTKKTIVPQAQIIKAMKLQNMKSYTCLYTIKALIQKEYIRKAVTQHDGRTYYVQIRNISIPEDDTISGRSQTV